MFWINSYIYCHDAHFPSRLIIVNDFFFVHNLIDDITSASYLCMTTEMLGFKFLLYLQQVSREIVSLEYISSRQVHSEVMS